MSMFRSFRVTETHVLALERATVGVFKNLYLVSCCCHWDPHEYRRHGGWVPVPAVLAMELVEAHLIEIGAPGEWIDWAQAWKTLFGLETGDFPAQPPHVQCR